MSVEGERDGPGGGTPAPAAEASASLAAIRDAMLDMEEPLAELRGALVAIDLIASGDRGIERDDLVGLRFLGRQAREIAESVGRRWRVAVDRLDGADRD